MKRLLIIVLLLSLLGLSACGLFGPGEEERCEITVCLGPDPLSLVLRSRTRTACICSRA